jgi:single-strand DNA-binding protein
MLNRVTLVGYLGKDPEVRRLDNGTSVGKFTIATNEVYRDTNNELQTQTEWHEVVVWRQLAEQVEKVLRKGALVYLEGKITHRKYTDKNGIDRTATEIVAAMFRTLERKSDNPNAFPSQEPPSSQYNRPMAETNVATSSQDIPAQSNNQAVPFEVIEPTNSSEVSEPVGEDGLPF